MKKVFIDSDIFVRDLRYPLDSQTKVNSRFLEKVKKKELTGFTSIFNVLETCGILSFNLSPEDLIELYGDFAGHYGLRLLFPADSQGMLQYDIPKIFSQIQKKQSLGDAQIAYTAERFANNLDGFVSWNAAHFQGKIFLTAVTPEAF